MQRHIKAGETIKVMDIIIRKANKEEAQQIAELFLLAWPVEEMAQSNGITAEMLLESVTAFAAREDTIYSYTNTYVAEIEGKIVGAMCGYDGADYKKLKQPIVDVIGQDSAFAYLQETEDGEYYLDSVGVLPEFRGRGYGKALLRKLAAIAVERGCGRLEWSCLDWNKPSIDFYLSLGAKPMDGWKVYRLDGETLRNNAE